MRLSDMKRDANSHTKPTETCSKPLVWGKRTQKNTCDLHSVIQVGCLYVRIQFHENSSLRLRWSSGCQLDHAALGLVLALLTLTQTRHRKTFSSSFMAMRHNVAIFCQSYWRPVTVVTAMPKPRPQRRRHHSRPRPNLPNVATQASEETHFLHIIDQISTTGSRDCMEFVGERNIFSVRQKKI